MNLFEFFKVDDCFDIKFWFKASATPIHEPEMMHELEPPTPIPQEYQPSIGLRFYIK